MEPEDECILCDEIYVQTKWYKERYIDRRVFALHDYNYLG